MSTVAALFNTSEEWVLKYIAFGGTVGYTGGIPGMTTGPTFSAAHLRLCISDPRTGVVYPNPFASAAGRNATYEPTSGEYSTYAPVAKNRFNTQWEVVETSSGVWEMRNLTAIVWPTPAGTGKVHTHVLLCLPSAIDGADHWAIAAAEFTTPQDSASVTPAAGIRELSFKAL